MFSLFSKKVISSTNSSRYLSTKLTDFPCSFEVITWPPGIKIKNEKRVVVNYKPLSAIEAKNLREINPSNRNIEMLGHAAANINFNLKHPLLDSDLKKLILNFSAKHHINCRNLEMVTAYVSWFPDSYAEGGHRLTGETLDFRSYVEKMIGHDGQAQVFPENIPNLNHELSLFFGAEVTAINSNFSNDTRMYGQPITDRTITLPGNLDYQQVFLSLANMMQPNQSKDEKTLLFNETMPNATYFGADILRKYLKYFGNSNDLKFSELINTISPAHVCTTSVLQLMEAAIGEIKCREIAQAVIQENNFSQVTAGLPLVDFTHYFAKAVEKEYLLMQSEKSSPGILKF